LWLLPLEINAQRVKERFEEGVVSTVWRMGIQVNLSPGLD
jgi:hypothetical protein